MRYLVEYGDPQGPGRVWVDPKFPIFSITTGPLDVPLVSIARVWKLENFGVSRFSKFLLVTEKIAFSDNVSHLFRLLEGLGIWHSIQLLQSKCFLSTFIYRVQEACSYRENFSQKNFFSVTAGNWDAIFYMQTFPESKHGNWQDICTLNPSRYRENFSQKTFFSATARDWDAIFYMRTPMSATVRIRQTYAP